MATVYPDSIVDKFVVDDGHVANPVSSFQVRGVYPPGFIVSVCGATVCGDGHVSFGAASGQFGVPNVTVSTAQSRAVSGLASAASFGVLTVKATITRSVGSVSSAQAFGTVRFRVSAPTGGVPTAQQFGVPATKTIVTRTVGSVASAQAFGAPVAKSVYVRTVSGLGSAQAFGTPTTKTTVRIAPASLGSAQLFGVPTVKAGTITVAVKGLSPGGAGYSDAVLADAPAIYWRLNGDATDASGHGRDGTPSAPLQWGVPSPIIDGGAVRIAAGQRVSVATFPAAEATPFSYEFWWKPNAAELGIYNTPVLKTTSNAWNDGFGCFWMNANHALFFWVGSYNTNLYAEPVDPGPWPDWKHFVYTYDGTTQRLYVDGALVTQRGQVGAAAATSGVLTLGTSATGTYTAPGDYDEFAFYDKVLTPARIAAHYAVAGVAAGEPQFGTPKAIVPVRPGGVSSAQAFGVPQAKIAFPVPGLDSAQVFGIPTIPQHVVVPGVQGSAAYTTSVVEQFVVDDGHVVSADSDLSYFGIPWVGHLWLLGFDCIASADVPLCGVAICGDSTICGGRSFDEPLACIFDAPIVDTFLVDQRVVGSTLYIDESECIVSPFDAICGETICAGNVCGGESFSRGLLCIDSPSPSLPPAIEFDLLPLECV